jgi:hypothetical protein
MVLIFSRERVLFQRGSVLVERVLGEQSKWRE